MIVRDATDEEKVAHDKALLEKALEDVDLSKVSANDESAANISKWIKDQINGAYTAITTTWDSAITVTADSLGGYNPPAVGGTADYRADVSIEVTSGAAKDIIDLGTVTVTVTHKG